MNIDDAYKIENYMTKRELGYLVDTVGKITNKTGAIVNIGVYFGASCAALLLGMQKHGIAGPLFAIDTFRYHNAGPPKLKPFRERMDVPWGPDFLEQVKSNLVPFAGDKEICYFQCFSDDFSLDVVDGISLILIDGDHTTHGCLLDALKYSQKLIDDGIMLFHDYTNFPAVQAAVALFTEIRSDFVMEDGCDSIAMLGKKCSLQP